MSALDTLWLIGILCFIAYLFLQVWDDTFGEALRVLRERPQPKPLKPRPYDWEKDLDARMWWADWYFDGLEWHRR